MPRPQSFDVAEALPPGIGVTGKMVTTIILSLTSISLQDCTDSQAPSPSLKLDILEFGSLLRGLWTLDPHLTFSFGDYPARPSLCYFSEQTA